MLSFYILESIFYSFKSLTIPAASFFDLIKLNNSYSKGYINWLSASENY